MASCQELPQPKLSQFSDFRLYPVQLRDDIRIKLDNQVIAGEGLLPALLEMVDKGLPDKAEYGEVAVTPCMLPLSELALS